MTTVDAIARVLVDQDRELIRLRAINDRMREQLDEIRNQHLPVKQVYFQAERYECIRCREPFPCATARAAAPGRVAVEEGDL